MTNENGRDYYREGIPIPETPAPGADPAPWTTTAVVGKPLPRVDAYERVSGTAVYPSDLVLPDMLYAVILRSPHANARVKRVDTAAARKLPGVRAVIDASTPGADLEWRYRGSVPSRLFDPACRFEGDAVAAVAADTPYQARDAARAIAVEYEVLPFVSDEGETLKPGAPAVHEGGNAVSEEQGSERGDVESGFAQADVVLEETYRTACEIHTPMELHGCVARWDGDALTIWESTQGVYAVQSLVAETLKLPQAKVRVIGHYMGGGFGSKLQAGKYTVIAALLARMTARPVKLFLSREETFLAVGNRPPTIMTLKAGVKRDGTLTALDYRATGASGAYPAGGAGTALDWLVRDLYTCPNVRTRTRDVYLNAGPARAFRAPGHPPCAWALEQMMDALAEAIGMDPVELRLKNVPAVSQGRGGVPYTTTGFADCLRKGAAAFGWAEARKRAAGASKGHLKRGVGVAGGLWAGGGGGPPSTVILKLFSDGSMNLNLGASDIGTGTKTVMAMVVSEELGIKPELIQIEHADTGTTQYATPSGGSKTVPTESPAVRAAAVEVKRQLLELAGEELEVEPAGLTFVGSRIVSRADRAKGVEITDLKGLERRGVVVGIGYRGPNPEGKAVVPFAAQFCEVEVNTRTGETRILRFLGAHDSGRVMNRLTFDNQVMGGITMGIGLAMTEGRILDAGGTGKMVNRNWHDYKLPTMLDTAPENVCLPVEPADTEANTTGAKGLGEPATIPTAPAVANAIHHATGVRVTGTPADPARLVALLAAKGGTGR